jgi:hypothetical protein
MKTTKIFRRFNPRREAVLVQRKSCFWLLIEMTGSHRRETIVEPTLLRATAKARTLLRRWWDQPKHRPKGEKHA